MKVAIGTPRRIRYDWHGPSDDPPVDGDLLRTRTGRMYLILDCRLVRGHAARYALEVIRVDPDYVTDERVLTLVWDRRDRRAR